MANKTGKRINGYATTPTYISWNSARKRVREGKGNYANIEMDPRWYNSFLEFLKDMGERPEGTTLDRINPNDDYRKGNCRWADNDIQQRNRTNNKIHIVNGTKMTEAEIARLLGISHGNLWKEIHYKNRSIEEILNRRGFNATVE